MRATLKAVRFGGEQNWRAVAGKKASMDSDHLRERSASSDRGRVLYPEHSHRTQSLPAVRWGWMRTGP